jgi:hypothetical protein
MNITITDLKRKANFKRLIKWLAEHTYLTVTHDGDPVCEIHKTGTGKRLDEQKKA